MRRRFEEFVSHRSYDAVQVEDIQMAQYAWLLSGIARILDMHNIESALMWRYAAIEGDPLRTSLRANYLGKAPAL